jgi:hypothetical protein
MRKLILNILVIFLSLSPFTSTCATFTYAINQKNPIRLAASTPPGSQKKGITSIPSFLGNTPPGWNEGLKRGWNKNKNWKWNKNTKMWENKNWKWNKNTNAWDNVNPGKGN